MNFQQSLTLLNAELKAQCFVPAVYTSGAFGSKNVAILVESAVRIQTTLDIDSAVIGNSLIFLLHRDDLWPDYLPQVGDTISLGSQTYVIVKSLTGAPHFEYADSTRQLLRIYAKPLYL